MSPGIRHVIMKQIPARLPQAEGIPPALEKTSPSRTVADAIRLTGGVMPADHGHDPSACLAVPKGRPS
jgi:hypothetical protein